LAVGGRNGWTVDQDGFDGARDAGERGVGANARTAAAGDCRLRGQAERIDAGAAPVGRDVAQLMLHRLVDAAQFHVYDPQLLRAAASASRSPQAEDALRADARDAGVDYLVLGSVTQFSMEETRRGFGGGGLIHGVPIGGFGGRRISELCLSILVRVVDVRTGEVVTTAIGTGDGRRSHVAAGALLAVWPGVGGFARESSNARDAQLAEATRQAVDAASAGLVSAAARLAAATVRRFE
jgi:curli biogenesis system outer membrane secretion channel CsgG